MSADESGWSRVRLKDVACHNAKTLVESTDSGMEFRYIDIGNVEQGKINVPGEVIRFGAAPSRARRLAEPGDTVVSTVRTYLRAVATVPESDEALVFSTGFAVLHPHAGVDPRWLAYAVQADNFVDAVVAHSEGVSYPAINASDLVALHVQRPPHSEQRAIADYLDDQTAKIDALIAKQEQLIELLEERRKSVVATFVVRGLDKSVTMRDTGVGWLGEVPQHWTQVPTRAVLGVEKDLVGSSWSDTQLLSLTKRGVVTRDIDSGEGKFPASFEDYQRVEPGDLVFCLFDLDETPRTVGLVRDRGMLTGAYTRFRVRDAVADAAYLEYYYVAIDDEKRFRPLYTGLRKVIQKPRFLGAPMVLPPLKEQREIADRLDRETSRIDALVAKTREHIALAKERRSALITAAVTGQIDVRTATREVA